MTVAPPSHWSAVEEMERSGHRALTSVRRVRHCDQCEVVHYIPLKAASAFEKPPELAETVLAVGDLEAAGAKCAIK